MLDELAEIRQTPFLRLFRPFSGGALASRASPGNIGFSVAPFKAFHVETAGEFSLFVSDFFASRNAESVRRITLAAKLIYCTCKRGLLDFVLAHGEPVLCRYAPNPR
jgi:hypothetical protein